MSVYLGSEEQALKLLSEYADEIQRVTPAGTQVVVLPEKIARVSEGALAEVDSLYSSAATATRTRQLFLVLFEKRRPAPSIRRVCIRPMEN